MPLLGIGFFLLVFILMVGGTTGMNTCVTSDDFTNGQVSVSPSIDEFVQAHKEAYILSWKAGGFLPSASISQTMVENGFNFTNPSGTSFWQAHNMGGVKTSKRSDFPITLATFGQDAVDITGTKEGTNVGDNTGGAYTWFKDYNAGIVGKAEFMAHQTLYTGAINNTDGVRTLQAIYEGGWATDPSYLVKLVSTYNELGVHYQWLDQEAIATHGTSPYQTIEPSVGDTPTLEEAFQPTTGCPVSSENTHSSTGSHSAPTLALPEFYQGKLELPLPNNENYEGNLYPFGQCTWGAYNRMAQIGQPIEWFSGDGGNGGSWGQSARERGYTVVQGVPSVGWAVSFQGGIAGAVAPYGHIAVVEYVNEDGSILVSETNVIDMGSGTRSWRVLDKATVQQLTFIQGNN